jgi:hypothetical protein
LRTTKQKPSRFRVRGIDICQRYVFPIRGPIFCSFSLFIYHIFIVHWFIPFQTGSGLCVALNTGPLPSGATYVCHRFLTETFDAFCAFVLISAMCFEGICVYPRFTSDSVPLFPSPFYCILYLLPSFDSLNSC